MDDFTEVTSTSWLERIKGAFVGILFGLILTVVAFPVLFWNEGRSVNEHKKLQEGAANYISVDDAQVNPENEGKLVHMISRTAVEGSLKDDKFGIEAEAIRLRRNVEMYQWVESSRSETKKKLGGGTETVTKYSYQKQWRDRVVNSGQFKKPAEHGNPGSMPVKSSESSASKVMVGAFKLPDFLVGRIQNFVPVSPGSDVTPPEGSTVNSGGFYFGTDSANPSVGDTRVKFEAVFPGEVSLIAKQVKDTFEPYQAKTGKLTLLETGTHSADSMFQSAEQSNKLMTWVLRVGGFLVMGIGLVLISRPLSVVADVVPFIGNIVGGGTGLISFLLAGVLSLGTIAIAWLTYRPIIGIAVLIGMVALIVLLVGKIRNSRSAETPPPVS